MMRPVIAVLCILSIWGACTDAPPEQLTYDQRKLADSLAKIEMKMVADSLDSLCNEHFEGYVETAYDSILENQKEEIKRLMK